MGKLKVILCEDMPKLGDAGDVVEVKPGYDRNYLFPQGIALPATAARVNEIEHHRRIIAERQAALLKDLKAAGAKIRSMDLTFEAHAGDGGKLFGSITPAMITARIGEQGIEIDRRKIQTEPIKSVGDHDIRIRLHKELILDAVVKVTAADVPDDAAAGDELLAEEPEPIGFGSMDEY